MHLPYPNRNRKVILQKSFKWRISGSLDWSHLAQLWAWKIIKAEALGYNKSNAEREMYSLEWKLRTEST